MSLNLQFQAIACNRVAACAHWSQGLHCNTKYQTRSGLVAYAAGSFVGLYDVKNIRLVTLLREHSDRVNCISWMRSVHQTCTINNNETELVSGGQDGSICIWRCISHEDDTWNLTAKLSINESGITSIDAIELPGGASLIVSFTTNGEMLLWYREIHEASWRCVHSFFVHPKQTVECITLGVLPGFGKDLTFPNENKFAATGLVLATGCVDSKIRLYSINSKEMDSNADGNCIETQLLLTLSGHLDWIRDLAFAPAPLIGDTLFPVPSTDVTQRHFEGDLILASASQDNKVRLWRVHCPIFAQYKAASEGKQAISHNSLKIDSDELGTSTLNKPLSCKVRLSVALRTKRWENVKVLTTIRNEATNDVETMVETKNFTSLRFEATKEAVLSGHEGWVTSVNWSPSVLVNPESVQIPCNEPVRLQPSCILTSSQDKSVVLWSPEHIFSNDGIGSGVWLPSVRVGSIGGKAAGFFGAVISPTYEFLLGHNYQGAFHAWKHGQSISNIAYSKSETMDTIKQKLETLLNTAWTSHQVISGHFGPVNDLAWDSKGRYFLSASGDQTVRAYAPWYGYKQYVYDSKSSFESHIWKEFARPQVHGYDMSCLCVPPIHGHPHTLVSGGDEKILRVFDAPKTFLHRLSELIGHESMSLETEEDVVDRPEEAYVPELQLSNKAILDGGQGRPPEDPYAVGLGLREEQRLKEMARVERKQLVGDAGVPDQYQAPVGSASARGTEGSRRVRLLNENSQSNTQETTDITTEDTLENPSESNLMEISNFEPPVESELNEGTLWAEIHKLYGHGNELVCMTSNHSGTLIASACRARDTHDASIILWKSNSWIEHQRLDGHELSVLQMKFSHDDRFLISVSKDRHFCVFMRETSNNHTSLPTYTQIAKVKAHKRVIWTVAFNNDDSLFATGARDGSLKIWTIEQTLTDEKDSHTLRLRTVGSLGPFKSAVTAVAFATPSVIGKQTIETEKYRDILAVGLENGEISIWGLLDQDSSSTETMSWKQITQTQSHTQHNGAVKSLTWQPVKAGNQSHLASCSVDGSVRLFTVE